MIPRNHERQPFFRVRLWKNWSYAFKNSALTLRDRICRSKVRCIFELPLWQDIPFCPARQSPGSTPLAHRQHRNDQQLLPAMRRSCGVGRSCARYFWGENPAVLWKRVGFVEESGRRRRQKRRPCAGIHGFFQNQGGKMEKSMVYWDIIFGRSTPG